MSYYNCIDVSEHNKDIDWELARQDDVEYAIIRAGFGQDYESQDDKYFHINMRNAITAGVKVGIYFYSYAKTVEEAIGEAEHCRRLADQYKDQLALPIFYDVEENSIMDHVEDTVPAFTKYLNDCGYNVGVYAMGSWFTGCLQYVAIDYLWVASWGSDDGIPHVKPEWCDIWQYTSKGSVIGVGYNCVDCDIIYNEEMKALIDEVPIPKTINVEMDVLKIGDEGNQVETLQILLNGFGYRDNDGNELKVDSVFGPKTKEAVINYQKYKGIEADGIVGGLTWNAILK